MRGPFTLALLVIGATAHAQVLAPGTYTNEEEVYFAREAKTPPAPWTGLQVAADGAATRVDAFGAPLSGAVTGATMADGGGIALKLPDGKTTMLRRARSATCWGSALRAARKADGSEDWYFIRDLKLHDQGGRTRFRGGDTGTDPVVLRMRNVAWSSGPNRPSLVLYVHRPDAPDRAVSYVWADPDAKRIGINLRWMQASCTIDMK